MESPNTDPRPSGRRIPMPHAYRAKVDWNEQPAGRVDRRTLLRAAEQAGRALTLPCSVRTVLSVLAAVYGEQELSQGLMVWPSNAYLEAKTGLSERSLRYAILRLRQEALVLAIDSPNGKRFARRRHNSVVLAFGFNLAPLYARRAEFAATVEAVETHAALCKALRHDLNAARKDIEDIMEGLAGVGRTDLARPLAAALEDTRPPRSKFVTAEVLQALLVRVEMVRSQAEHDYYRASNRDESAGSGGKNSRHKESNTDFSIEYCKEDRSGASAPPFETKEAASGGIWAFREKGGGDVRSNEQPEVDGTEEWRTSKTPEPRDPAQTLLDAGLWREACPDLADYGPVASMEDVAHVGRMVSRMLQVAPHGLDRWQKRLGPALFPLVAAYVYQVYADDQLRTRPEIRKPGGFFCYVAKEVAEGVRDLGLDVMALRRKRTRH